MMRKRVFWFWGAMDAFLLIRYAVTSVMGGRIPYLSDIENASWLLREHSVVQFYMFVFAMLLQVSIVISCVLFFLGRESVKWVVYVQTPFRLAFIVPSVSLLLVGAQLFRDYNLVLMAVLVVVSEGVKVWSVWRWGKKS
ncbi:hypothetical protein ACEN2T_17025 [Pseudomonas sp. W22_MBD1_FP4]|uniref:hypothetical protein n=1 Tax=unclassified Pseudomonas TaxID=196821 RepID=UPI000518A9CF|nr:hypothetical protein [Pseudomonas sp. RIT357]